MRASIWPERHAVSRGTLYCSYIIIPFQKALQLENRVTPRDSATDGKDEKCLPIAHSERHDFSVSAYPTADPICVAAYTRLKQ
jgi:hypothetical protein